MDEVRRVIVVMLENEDAGIALQQPFLGELARRGAYLANYHALTHPSQPNYIGLTAGSVYGITTDGVVTIDVPHIGDLIEAADLDWRVYAEDYPGNCFLGSFAGSASSGQYLRRHVPFLDYLNIQNDTARCKTHIVDATQFDADVAAQSLPAFSMYIPNTHNDGHDTDVATADRWLQGRFATLLADSAFMEGTLFVVVFDEGTFSGPNVVYCVLVGAGVRPGTVSQQWYNHYDLLRTFEALLRLGTLHHHDEVAIQIRDIWR